MPSSYTLTVSSFDIIIINLQMWENEKNSREATIKLLEDASSEPIVRPEEEKHTVRF